MKQIDGAGVVSRKDLLEQLNVKAGEAFQHKATKEHYEIVDVDPEDHITLARLSAEPDKVNDLLKTVDTAAFLIGLKVGEWRVSLTKHVPTKILLCWNALADPRKSSEWQQSLACARQLVNLNDAADSYTSCDAWVDVVSEPASLRGLVAKIDIPPKECVLVPLTTHVACKAAVPKDAVPTTTKVKLRTGQRGTVCFIKPKLQLPTKDLQGFVAHFWVVQETKTEEEANMAPYTPPGTGFHLLRNIKLIKAGERLYKLEKKPDEARVSEACGSGAKLDKKRKRTKDA